MNKKVESILGTAAAIAIGATVAGLTVYAFTRQPPVFTTRQRAEVQTSEPRSMSGLSWSQIHALSPELLGGQIGTLALGGGNYAPNPRFTAPSATAPELLGGSQGYVTGSAGKPGNPMPWDLELGSRVGLF